MSGGFCVACSGAGHKSREGRHEPLSQDPSFNCDGKARRLALKVLNNRTIKAESPSLTMTCIGCGSDFFRQSAEFFRPAN